MPSQVTLGPTLVCMRSPTVGSIRESVDRIGEPLDAVDVRTHGVFGSWRIDESSRGRP